MGWEQRGNRTYYYRAARVGGRVVKEYIPPLAVQAAVAAADRDRADRAAAAAAVRAACGELDSLATVLEPLDALADALARAAMLAAGYHRHHRGPWRKRRVQPDPTANTPEGE